MSQSPQTDPRGGQGGTDAPGDSVRGFNRRTDMPVLTQAAGGGYGLTAGVVVGDECVKTASARSLWSADAGSVSTSSPRNCCRARYSRDITVPTGMASISAICLCGKPST